MTGWYEKRADRDQVTRTTSLGLVERELGVFANAMSLVEDCLAVVLSHGLVADHPTQAKIMVGNHAFNLLRSAWESALVGRYGSATNHWRSISEAPRFLMALHLNAGLASDMLAGRMKIETALRTIKKEFRSEKYPGADLKWVDGMKDELDWLQPFSHMNVQATVSGLPVWESSGEQVHTVIPGGILSTEKLRIVAMWLADAAISLAAGLVFGFREVEEMIEEIWESKGRATLEEGVSALEELRELPDAP